MTAMELDDPFDVIQSKSHSMSIAGSLLAPIKYLKEIPSFGHRDLCAFVANVYPVRARCFFVVDGDRGTGGSIFDRICDQV